MWAWFRNKRPKPSSELETIARQWVAPQALAVAVAKSVRTYVDEAKAGRISYPAHRRKDSSVIEIWRDLRLEALHNLFNFGRADPFLLSDQRRQMELLTCFLDEPSHLEMPQPRGQALPDTIQAMWQVYHYLDRVGSEVVDRETDRATLKMAGRTILDNLTAGAEALRGQWEAFEDAVRLNAESPPEMPRTLFEILYEDVTSKAKSVALSAIFGPSHEAGIKNLERLVEERGGEAGDIRAKFEQIMAAKDPDGLVR